MELKAIGALIARIAIGGILIVAGALKAGHANELANTIAAFQIPFLPWSFAQLIGAVLPFFEIVLGLYIVVGLFTRVAAWIAAAQFTLFAVAIASVVIRKIPTSCGCFGPGDTAPASWLDVVRDAALIVVSLYIVWRAPGAFAVDNRLRKEI